MAARLRATYPGAPWTSKLLAAGLGLVLPVLDGLDEMPAQRRRVQEVASGAAR